MERDEVVRWFRVHWGAILGEIEEGRDRRAEDVGVEEACSVTAAGKGEGEVYLVEKRKLITDLQVD